MSTNEVSPAKQAVILSGRDNWDKWYTLITTSTKANPLIWRFVDPEQPEETYPKEPTRPSRNTDTRPEQYELELRLYMIDQNKFDKQETELARLFKEIMHSVDSRYYMHFKKASTPYQALRLLKELFAPTTNGRERELRRQYQAVLAKKIGNVELWTSEFMRIFYEVEEYNLPEAHGDRPLLDFLEAGEAVAPAFANQVRTSTLLGEQSYKLATIIERFKEAVVYERKAKKGVSHAAFATSSDTTTKSGRQPCPCGKDHLWPQCFYLNKEKPYRGWKPNQEVKQNLINALKKNPDLARRIYAAIKRQKGVPNPDIFNGIVEKDDDEMDTASKGQTIAAFTASAYTTSTDYRLRDHWLLDSGTDIHVTNSSNDFIEERKASSNDKIIAGGALFQITAYGTCRVPVKTPTGMAMISLLNTAYIPGFMSNLISLSKLVEKDYHWDTKSGFIKHRNERICSTFKYGGHWTVTVPKDAIQGQISAYTASQTTKTSVAPRYRAATTQAWHQLMGHPSKEALMKLPTSTEGVRFTNSVDTAVCESCRLSKATEQVSRRTGHEAPAQAPFERISWDLTYFEDAYDGDQYMSHFKCFYTGFNHVYTQPNKSLTFQVLKQHLQLLKTQYKANVKFIRLDGETSLGNNFARLAAKEGFIIERSATSTQAQNGHAERGGRSLVTMARNMRIEANLPSNLWPELVKAAGYYLNRIPTKGLQWKTPFEAVYGVKPSLGHIRLIGCKAFIHQKDIPKLQKLDPRAKIGYLLGYQSTNQWRIWLPENNEVKIYRDVTFDEQTLYHPERPEGVKLVTAHPEKPPQPLPQVLNGVEKIPDANLDPIYKPLLTAPSTLSSSTPRPAPQSEAERAEKAEGLPTPEKTQGTLPTPSPTPEPEPASNPLANEVNEPQDTPYSSNIELFNEIQPLQTADPRTTTPNEGSEALNSIEGPDSDGLIEPSDAPDDAIEGAVFAPTAPEYNRTHERRRERDPPMSELILPEGSKRQRKPRRQAYAAACLAAEQDLNEYHSAFATSEQVAKPPGRLHQNELPLEPRHWREMQNHQFHAQFTEAARIEWNALRAKGTFIEQDLPSKKSKALPLTWVFKYKFDKDGFLDKFKARICVRGDLQTTEEDKYAATLAASSFRALMAITAAYDLEIKQVDAINAFLNSDLDEEVYIKYPPGMERANKVLRLVKALYGLKRSPRLWYEELTGTLRGLGLNEINGMKCVMASNDGIVFFYVDDIMMLYHHSKSKHMNALLDQLQAKYPLRVMDQANWFLGIRIVRNRQTKQVWLCQDTYIDKIAAKYHIQGTRVPHTPLPNVKMLPNEEKATLQETLLYQQIMGSNNFAATMTRPDIAFSISNLSQFLQNPSTTHLASARRIIGYLQSTKTYALQLTGQLEMNLTVYSDASFADLVNRRSSQGCLIALGGNIIDWKASKQKTVTTSSTEAELMAIDHAIGWAMQWKRALAHLKQYLAANPEPINLSPDIKVFCDNTQTIRLLTQSINELDTKLRHVDIRNCWVREKVQQREVTITWVPTVQMKADGLTKALTGDKHEAFIKALNIQRIEVDTTE